MPDLDAMPLSELLAESELVEETHAFLWTDAFVNKGMRDGGWSCRDHALVIGSLLLRRGEEVELRHGRCMFVHGPTAAGEPPVGNGQDVEGRGTGHTWLYVTGLGDVDLSPKLSIGHDRWRPVSGPGVIGSTWVADIPTEFVDVADSTDYGNEIARASRAVGVSRAIYCHVEAEGFGFGIASAGLSWANSRVSLRLLHRIASIRTTSTCVLPRTSKVSSGAPGGR